MNAVIPVVIWISGILVSALLVNFLRLRASDVVANGLGWVVLGLSHYPIMLWITGSPHQFTTLAIWSAFCLFGSIAGAVVYSRLAGDDK